MGAIVFTATHQFAFAAVAGGSGTVGIRAADLRRADASLVRCGVGCESGGATADRLVVGAPAGAVGSAESIARIHATTFKAGGFRWTVVVSAGAGAVSATSVNVRIADGIRLAGADGSSGRSLTQGRLVARIGGAHIGRKTFDFWVRIWFESGRTRAHGHVIFRQTDGVLAATVGHANRNAFVVRFVTRRGR